MAHRLEITLKEDLFDPEGAGIQHKAADYFGIAVERIRTVAILTIDADFSEPQLARIRTIFTNPVTQVSSWEPLPVDFDYTIWVGYRPGVRDNPGATAVEAIEDVLGIRFTGEQAVYTSRRYCLQAADLDMQATDRIAGELLANDIIQQWKVFARGDWNPARGIGFIVPRVVLDHQPTVTTIPIDSDATLNGISKERNLALNPNDVPTIRAYFLDPEVVGRRRQAGLADPTDIELEYISQARSDHCNHNTFNGLFRYRESANAPVEIVDNLFDTCIKAPTLELKERKSWVVSVLWDNAGVGRFDDDHYYVITGETHNSPSNMEAYGGAITGIVGVYRDPMGTGRGAQLIMGSYGYCVGPRDYDGPLSPRLHPRRLLDGVIEGVRDGGNKSGIPTPFGQVTFDPGYLGKCLVFVTALGIMPAAVRGEPAEEKSILPGDFIVMCGGRVGKDGIHGVTASSETYSENTPAGHVQIGDPYTQKKMHDFLLEARDEGLTRFITDNGGGGLSSSVGESALFSNGCHVQLEKVPLKYDGLDQWEIWISESQERMTVAVPTDCADRFFELSGRHAVESTVIGEYTDSGCLTVTWKGEPCASIDLDLLTKGFPQWEFDAHWSPPEERGLAEPVLGPPSDMGAVLESLLASPNLCSSEWIARQYDHEVQGSSIIKPLVGVDRDVNSDAAVLRPVLTSEKGLAFAQALLPSYSRIDAYHMVACTIDEAVRRLLAVGADFEQIGGVDNFCWPSIQYDKTGNPDGRFKAAQLVRACRALRDLCLAYEVPLLSGKDSMYVDGHLPGDFGETHKVSAPETLQFSASAVVNDIGTCITMDAKEAGDLVYVMGTTADELGGSAYYALLGYTGCRVPQVDAAAFKKYYRLLNRAIGEGVTASVHGVYSGGLVVHLAMVAMAGELGMAVELASLPVDGDLNEQVRLFSESAGRFIVTVAPGQQEVFEAMFTGFPVRCVGRVTQDPVLEIRGLDGNRLVHRSVADLKTAWKKPFKDL